MPIRGTTTSRSPARAASRRSAILRDSRLAWIAARALDVSTVHDRRSDSAGNGDRRQGERRDTQSRQHGNREHQHRHEQRDQREVQVARRELGRRQQHRQEACDPACRDQHCFSVAFAAPRSSDRRTGAQPATPAIATTSTPASIGPPTSSIVDIDPHESTARESTGPRRASPSSHGARVRLPGASARTSAPATMPASRHSATRRAAAGKSRSLSAPASTHRRPARAERRARSRCRRASPNANPAGAPTPASPSTNEAPHRRPATPAAARAAPCTRWPP